MKYKIKTRQYCSLAKEQLWQSFLYTVAPDLHDDLVNHLSTSTSCRSNTIKMENIQASLEARKLLPRTIEFLKKEYSFVIEEIKESFDDKDLVFKGKIIYTDASQNIFKNYNHNLLTFPQKVIIENDSDIGLRCDIAGFIKDKLNVDYVIVGNRAYIEYFKIKYSNESKLIKSEDRDIYKFKNKI